MTEHIITNSTQLRQVIDIIKSLDFTKRWLIKIVDWTGQRTAAQNRLLWKWNTEIGKGHNLIPEECHLMLKEKYLCNIFKRDDPGYAKMAQALIEIRHKPQYHILKQEVIRLTSTTNCSPVQMTEYLTKIKMHAFEHGIPITIPPDREMEWLTNVKNKKSS